MRDMENYSTRRLLLSTTLIAIGFGLLWFFFNFVWPGHEDQSTRAAFAMAGLWISAGAFIGAGIMTPFKLGLFGMAMGGIIICLLGFLWALLGVGHLC